MDYRNIFSNTWVGIGISPITKPKDEIMIIYNTVIAKAGTADFLRVWEKCKDIDDEPEQESKG